MVFLSYPGFPGSFSSPPACLCCSPRTCLAPGPAPSSTRYARPLGVIHTVLAVGRACSPLGPCPAAISQSPQRKDRGRAIYQVKRVLRKTNLGTFTFYLSAFQSRAGQRSQVLRSAEGKRRMKESIAMAKHGHFQGSLEDL